MFSQCVWVSPGDLRRAGQVFLETLIAHGYDKCIMLMQLVLQLSVCNIFWIANTEERRGYFL